MLPPLLLYVRVGSAAKSGIGLWLPLFLVWLIFLPVLILVLIIAAATDIVLLLLGRTYHHYTLLLLGCSRLLGATRGTTIHVNSKDGIVDIDLV